MQGELPEGLRVSGRLKHRLGLVNSSFSVGERLFSCSHAQLVDLTTPLSPSPSHLPSNTSLSRSSGLDLRFAARPTQIPYTERGRSQI